MKKEKIFEPIYKLNLPIMVNKNEIITKIQQYDVLIIEGETGSGKTTQISKFAIEAGRGISGKIALTQPRRIAAISVAHRIAKEMNEVVGKLVGYKVRFKKNFSETTCIKVMTDGILLLEVQKDPWLTEYDTIIIDEAHERSLNIDLIFGILKKLLSIRKDLKLIISSATIDVYKFSKIFENSAIISVKGHLYPVKVSYLPENSEQKSEELISYIDMVVDAIDKICEFSHYGDILVFVPTEHDVREICSITLSKYRDLIILPLFARLQLNEQKKVFMNYVKRKIIISTNVAETSITIPGIKYVIDTGLARVSKYLPNSRINALPILPISRSSADQRKGRCGRVENGVCLRLYKESDYDTRPFFAQPEILRSKLSEIILKMISLNLGSFTKFPFIDKPLNRNFRDGFKLLIELGAITGKNSKNYKLTGNGRIMSKLALDSRLSRVLIEAVKEGCLEEAMIVVSALSVSDPFERPTNKENQAYASHKIFKNDSSDFITLLNIWKFIFDGKNTKKKIKKICTRYFLSFSRIMEWINIHDQIRTIIKDQQIFRNSIKGNKNNSKANNQISVFSPLYQSLHKSILAGFLSNIAVKKDKYNFIAAKKHDVMIFPGSGVFNNKKSKWIVAAEFVKTTRLFARRVAIIDPMWLESLGGPLCKYSWFDPHWERNKSQVIAYERVSLFGLVIIEKRPIAYGHIEPEISNEIFIRRALVDCDVKKTIPFMDFNKQIINFVKNVEDRVRRRDIFIGEENLVNFYKKKLSNVFDMKTLKYQIRRKGDDYFLRMTKDDICSYYPKQEEIEQFPENINLGNGIFKCSYTFQPGKKEDGITITIPVTSIGCVQKNKLGWLVPGLFREKIKFLIRGLDKQYRKKLFPISNTIDLIVKKMPRYHKNILISLSQFISENLKVEIPVAAWPINHIPDYLKMRMVVRDEDGSILVSSRDESLLLKTKNDYKKIDVPNEIKKQWEFDDIKDWDFGDLPEHIFINHKKFEGSLFYPRLQCVLSNVSIRLFNDASLAMEEHKKGVANLLVRYFSKEIKFMKRIIKLPKDFKDKSKYFGGLISIESQIYNKLFEELFSLSILKTSEFKQHILFLKKKGITNCGELKREQVLNILKSFQNVTNLITNIRRSYQKTSLLYKFSNVIESELIRLVPENFVKLYTSDKLSSLLRYIAALNIRTIRGIDNLERDTKRALLIKPYILSLEKLITSINDVSSIKKREAIENFFWMLEEYKISLFAQQEIKTDIPISQNKLDNFLKDIRLLV